MIVITFNTGDNFFTMNGRKFTRNYQAIAQGESNISINNIYDTRYQILGSTSYDEIEINGNTYSSQDELLPALIDVLKQPLGTYSRDEIDLKDLNYFNDIKETVESINAGEGGKSYPTLADAQAVNPVPSDGTVFQVENDGYYIYDSTSTGGTKFLRDFVYDLNDQELATIKYGGYVFDTLSQAKVLTTKPLDNIGFSVKESTDPTNAGYYVFHSSATGGTSFLRGFVNTDSEIQSNQQKYDVNTNILNQTEYNFTDAIMLPDGSLDFINGGFANASSIIPVIPGETFISFAGAKNHNGTPSVLGFSKDQNTITIISQGVDYDEANLFEYLVEKDIYFLRFGSTSSLSNIVLKIDSIASKFDKTFVENNIKKDDYFINGGLKEHFLADGKTSINPSFLGTGFVPVENGDTLEFKGYAFNAYAGLGGFDINKNYVKTIIGTTAKDLAYVVKIDDPQIAYVVGTHLKGNDPSTPFLKVSSSKTITQEIQDIKSNSLVGNLFNFQRQDNVEAYTTNSTVSIINGEKILEVIGSPAYWSLEPTIYKKSTHSNSIATVELELIELPPDSTSVNIEYHLSDVEVQNVDMSLNDRHTFTMYTGKAVNNLIKCNLVGVKFKVLREAGAWMEDTVFNKLKPNEIESVLSEESMLDEGFIFNIASTRAYASSKLDTIYKGGKYVAFGDSVTVDGTRRPFGYIREVGKNLQMDDYMYIGNDGRTPQQIYADEYLLTYPTDATLVTLTGGLNTNPVFANDLTSRDRTTYEGCLNYAIDHIYATTPLVRIILMTSHLRFGVTANPFNQVLRDIGELRNIIVCDAEKLANINADQQAVLTTDGTHLNAEGNKRIAGAIIGTVKNIGY